VVRPSEVTHSRRRRRFRDRPALCRVWSRAVVSDAAQPRVAAAAAPCVVCHRRGRRDGSIGRSGRNGRRCGGST